MEEKHMNSLEKCMTTTMLGEKAYYLSHIAYNLGVNVETVRRAVRAGKLKAYYTCGRYYVLESDLNKWIKE